MPVKFVKGVGPARAELLESELGIRTLQDLFYLFPHRYVDRSRIHPIASLPRVSADVQVKGRIVDYREEGAGPKKRLIATLDDGSGELELIWFRNYKWVETTWPAGTEVIAYGRLNWYGYKPTMPHPELDTPENILQKGFTGLVPVYPSTEKLVKKNISNRILQKIIYEAFRIPGVRFQETLPEKIRTSYHLTGKDEAMRNIHFPQNISALSKAQFRLKFEELFFLQLQLLYQNRLRKKKIKGYVFEKIGDYFNRFYHDVLPFELTGAQKRVIREIRHDLKSGAQMNRLLQGDVGSGKTVVAMMSMLMALDNGFQAAMLAPTEILAKQHYQTISRWADALGIKVDLLTGSTKKSHRRLLHEQLLSGELQILTGTHALLEDKVQFHRLGLAVIDEQHRFGVAQRARMWKKSQIPPHMLIMTATPIPRTLAMTHYGDLDVSVIDELPPGRKPVKTYHLYDRDRYKAYHFVRSEVQAGRQAYIVFPIIEESKVLDYESLMEGYERIQEYFKNDGFRLGMVHGGMKSDEKDEVMRDFKEGKIHILVSTTVIEVGVDVPNASIMVIESAERFGLSQLHQLRGRVGRGADKAYCILITGTKLSEDGRTRMRTMVETSDGFRIAEVDLKLRGPGNVMGTQQSGLLRLKIADIVKDGFILQRARQAAGELLEDDPRFQKPENRITGQILQENLKHSGFWNYIG